MEAPPKGPYIQVAAFCESLIEGKDGTWSLIRVIDQVTHQAIGAGAPSDLPPLNYALKGVVMLKPGEARGRMNYEFFMERPNGIRTSGGGGSVTFVGGPNQGVNIPLMMNVTFDQEGTYWFDLFMDGQLLTRMPLQVIYNRVMPGSAPR